MSGPTAELLHGLLADAARRHGTRAALRDRDGELTYADLAAHADRYARWLHGRGIGPGDRVVARLHPGRAFAALLYAVARTGAAFVPLHRGMKPYHLGPVLADADAALCIVEADEAGLADGAVTADTLDRESRAATAPEAYADVAGDDIALLLYTSGTTATPKAVVCPHARVVFAARAIGGVLGYRADDVIACRLPLTFDYGLYQLFLAAQAGACVVLAQDVPDLGLLNRVRDEHATVVPVVPSLAALLAMHARRDRRPTSVRLFTNTGAALGAAAIADLRAAFPGAAVQPMYGTTECKRVTVLAADGDRAHPGSVGVALPGTEVVILGDDGVPVPPTTDGEIVVRGPHVMAGYWRAPDLTARVFRTGPDGRVSLHTGDYGHLGHDGHLYFTGRRDDLFKRGGLRVSVTEIEQAVLDIPGVTHAAVLAPDGDDDAVVCAVATLTPAELLRALATRLEAGKVPSRCRVIPAIPLTANGKPDRAALRALARTAP